MPENHDFDAQWTRDVPAVTDRPSTVDQTGAYQPAPDTEPASTGLAGGEMVARTDSTDATSASATGTGKPAALAAGAVTM